MNNTACFKDEKLLMVVNAVLSKSDHYKKILKIHLSALEKCETIADLACGTGLLALQLLLLGKKISAIDKSKESLQILVENAKRKNLTKKLKIKNLDITNLTSEKNYSYDGVSSMIAAHLVADYKRHIQESFRILKNDGVFVLTARSANKKQELIVDIVRKSLEKQNCFNNLKKEFEYLKDSLLLTANQRSKSLFKSEEAIKILRETGFKKIIQKENGTLKVMYTLIAYK